MLDLNHIYNENCLDTLRRMDDASIDCCVTSPPYFGLRDYGTAAWDGGDLSCDHWFSNLRLGENLANSVYATRGGAKKIAEVTPIQYKDVCGKCGAKRVDDQIGLESTIEGYVGKLVEVFTEVRRVLKRDGTLWLNLGDSYDDGKQLSGVPWRVAFALQQNGWWLRQDIIWHKPNPMPESVRDRCTKSHEYIFLLTKSAKYFYDHDAIKEPIRDGSVIRLRQPNVESQAGSATPSKGNGNMKAVASRDRSLPRNRNGITGSLDAFDGLTANKKSVWTITTQPFREAHFATFPEALVRPCILAGCRAGGTVYDPFSGSGTTAVVAHKMGRKWILSELNPEYVEIAKRRLEPILAQGNLYDG